MNELDHKQLQALYRWIDKVPLSRPKRNITRDFSDGVLMSEVVGHFFPEKVDLHNYSKSNSVHKKEYNWMTLNQKVFSKMGFTISKSDIKDVVTCVKGTVEQVLYQIQVKMASYQQRKKRAQDNKTAVSPNYAHNDNSSSNNNNSNSNTEPYFSPSHKQSPLYRVEDNDFNNAHSNNSNQNLNNGNREVKNKKVHNIAKRERLGHKKSPAGRVRKGRQPSLSPSRGAKSQLKGKLGASAGVGKHAAVARQAAKYQQQLAQVQAENTRLVQQLQNRDQTEKDLRETLDILRLKVAKLEQLLKLKNTKIAAMDKQLKQLTL